MKRCRETVFPSTALSLIQVVANNSTVALLLRKLGMSALAMALAVSQIVFSVAQAQTLSDDIDFDPPVIDHESLVSGISGELQVFSAVVVDDRGLERVTLYYRSETGQDYRQEPMQRLSATDNYTASVDSVEGQKKVEYYIEALDTGGNRVLKGFPFFPLVRGLEAPVAGPVVEQATAPPPAAKGNSALYLLLGVVAAGLIAAIASDSGGGGGGGEDPGDTVPLTINVSPP